MVKDAKELMDKAEMVKDADALKGAAVDAAKDAATEAASSVTK